MCEALLYLAVNKTRSAFCVVIFFPLFDARMNPPDTRLPSFCVVNSSFSRISNQFSAYSKLRTLSKMRQRPSKNERPVSNFLPSLTIRKKMSSHNLDGKIPAPIAQPRAKILSSFLPNFLLYHNRYTFLPSSLIRRQPRFSSYISLSRAYFLSQKCKARVGHSISDLTQKIELLPIFWASDLRRRQKNRAVKISREKYSLYQSLN